MDTNDIADRISEGPEPSRFVFPFGRSFLLAGLPLGIRPGTCSVEVDPLSLTAKFGHWSVHTPLANVVDARVTGPYNLAKVIGPPHVSLADRGLTFATNADQGVCIRFHEPVRGVDPLGLVRHPSLTVTVNDCARLAALVVSPPAAAPGQQQLLDNLSGRTTSELRNLAEGEGIVGASSMSKAALVTALERRAGDRLDEVLADE